MSNHETNEPLPEAIDEAEANADRLDAYDLDHDGKVSAIEGIRAEIGVTDARLEQLAEEPGLKGRLADAAHHVLDKLDND